MQDPFIVLTRLDPDEARPECELMALLVRRGIATRIVRTQSELDALSDRRILLMSWLKRVRPEVIERNRVMLNLHNSLLPYYRGRHAFAWALIHGEPRVGYTLHAIDGGFDTGPIYAQHAFAVAPEDDINDVFDHGHAVVRSWLPDTLERFDAGLLRPMRQVSHLGSYYPARSDADGRIDWNAPGEAIRNLVRALRPPYTAGAFFTAEGRVFRVECCLPEPRGIAETPGLLLEREPERNAVRVACADGSVRLALFSPPGAPGAHDLRHPTILT